MSNPKFFRNEVTYITNEIDYDKLAEAIVKASRNDDNSKQDSVVDNSSDTDINNNKCLTKALSSFCFLFLRCVAIFLFFVDFLVFVSLFTVIPNLPWSNWNTISPNILMSFVFLYLIVMIGMYAVLLWKAAREVSEDTDKNFMVSLFSSLICVAALIVSLVALFK